MNKDTCKVQENLSSKEERNLLAIEPKEKNIGQKFSALVIH